MLKKIILPVVLLIFTQQNFYGMKEKENTNKGNGKAQVGIWGTINNWVNKNETADIWHREKQCPKLWWLWAILDNVPFQYGGSKRWKHGEAYYGLSNGIGFFLSYLNSGWLKVGIGDADINVINLILDYIKNFIQCKNREEKKGKFNILSFLLRPIFINLFFNIHIFSFKILNCIKIKLIAPLTLLEIFGNFVGDIGYEDSTAWYITYNRNGQISWWYALLSPRIEINIPGIIDYFKGK